MKKRVIFLALCFPLFSSAQFHLELFGGVSNYQGDLQGKPITIDQSNGAFGAGVSYELTKHFLLRGGLMYGRVTANDAFNKPSLALRNLNFSTKIVEGSVVAEYRLFNLDDKRFTPYAFAGVAIYHFNPYTFDSTGIKYFLKPLGTEGQGLAEYADRKPYALTQFAIPFGGGVRMRISEQLTLGYEIGMRKLFTDYLDDVSTTYVDEAALLAARGPRAIQFSYRGDELKNGDPAFPVSGTLRGGAKSKDWYYFQGVSLSIRLGDGARSRRDRFGCPPAF